jgi:hypothetical protein
MSVELVEMVNVTVLVLAMHGPFLLTETGVLATREASETETIEALEWCQKAQTASMFWVGDLAEYGEHRYGQKYAQAIEATPYAPQTVMNAAYVARQIPKERRRPAVPFSHHAEVAPLAPAQQDHWLARCEVEGLTREQLRTELKTVKAAEMGQTVEYIVTVILSSAEAQKDLAEMLVMDTRVVSFRVETKTIGG